MSDKDGGPAFPRNYERDGHNGMTLRDYFAAAALSGVVLRRWENSEGKVPDDVISLWAHCSYLTADAMLKEREK